MEAVMHWVLALGSYPLRFLRGHGSHCIGSHWLIKQFCLAAFTPCSSSLLAASGTKSKKSNVLVNPAHCEKKTVLVNPAHCKLEKKNMGVNPAHS
jgi:hypothetical protein